MLEINCTEILKLLVYFDNLMYILTKERRNKGTKNAKECDIASFSCCSPLSAIPQ
jgi:hypothetical protein